MAFKQLRALTLPLAVTASLVAGLAAPAVATASDDRHGPVARCRRVSVAAGLAGGGTATMRGTLCRPERQATNTVQVLLAGLTYDSAYWNLRPAEHIPSYRESMNASGYATLALDRLGTGMSDRPAADQVNLTSEADAVHRVVTELGTGLNGAAFSRIVLVGHSFGSGVALAEAAKYQDVAGLVLSGYAHAAGPKLAGFSTAEVAAQDDPMVGPSDPPAGYLTTEVGSRAEFFYNTSDASAATILRDELTKSTMTTGEQATLGDAYDVSLAARVKVPVLIALGQQDQLLCGGQYLSCASAAQVRAYEAQFFTSAKLDAYVLPRAGHALNLHLNAADWYAESAEWTAGL